MLYTGQSIEASVQVCPGLGEWRKVGKLGLGAGRIFHPGVMFGLVNVLHAIWHVNFLDCHIFIVDFTFYQNEIVVWPI